MATELVHMDDRRAWGSVPAELHRIVVEEYERTGAIPAAVVLGELADMHPVLVRRTLKQLCEEGMLAQPHGERSPYVPLYRPDGTRVKPRLMMVGGEDEEHTPEAAVVDLERVSTEELLAEVLRRTQKDESK